MCLVSFNLSVNELYGIHVCVLSVKIQEYTNKCTILIHTALTPTSLELRHVQTIYCGSSSEGVHQYLYER